MTCTYLRRSSTLAPILAMLITTSCVELNKDNQNKALRTSSESGGPRVLFDLDERPFPEIPLPNDVATRIDPTSPTGRRVNVSKLGGIQAEQRIRQELNTQTGWGLYSTMSVRFDKPLDLHSIIQRHQEPVPNFEDDVVYLVNIDPDSEGYGELVMLDMGRGNFPLTLKSPSKYFPNDPNKTGSNLLFNTSYEKDTNGNGIFESIEDLDDDGVQDIPNLLDINADPYAEGQLLDFYERETNTLLLRPINPLRPSTTYAVVLTNGVTGEDYRPVDSPFEGINHTRQTAALEPLRDILPTRFPDKFNRSLDNIRFTWSFTTQHVTEDLEAIRAGLYGHGTFSWLRDAYPAKIELIHNVHAGEKDNPMVFKVDEIIPLLAPLISQATNPASGDAIAKTFESVDYVVSGSFISPHFLVDHDGLATELPAADEIEEGDHQAIDRIEMHEENESFDINPQTGFAVTRPDEVPFICIVPKATEAQQAPFPTIIYSHAIGSTRFEGLVFAGAMAKFGMATCTIDAVGHGVAIPAEFNTLLGSVSKQLDLENLPAVLNHHRARDIDFDGVADSGGDYFSTDLLHSRDNFRQSTIDQLQLVRLLRTFDGSTRFKAPNPQSPFVAARRDIIADFDADQDGELELLGDFNGDGVVDLGGDAPFVSWGTSLGGIHTTLLAGIEPSIKAVASNAGGGGLLDIAVRTTIANVLNGALLRMFGPLLVGKTIQRDDQELTELSFILPRGTGNVDVPIARIPKLEDGDIVVLRNRTRETSPLIEPEDLYSTARVRQGNFRVGIATDALPSKARHSIQGVSELIVLPDDLIGCKQRSRCGDESCSGDRTCNPEGDACITITDCMQSFDANQNFTNVNEEAHIVRTPEDYGDILEVEIYDANNNLKHTISTFELNTIYDGLLYPRGARLASLVEGWGIAKQTPRFRKFWSIGQMIFEPADPVIWAAKYARQPITFSYETPANQTSYTNALIVGTLGDQTVPINTALSLARSAGALNFHTENPHLGMTPNQHLIHSYVYEGIAELDRYPAYPDMLFDPDNLDQYRWKSSRDGRMSPETDTPLRSSIASPQGGFMALRLAYIDERGEHTFNAPNPTLPFDIHTFMLNQVGWYLSHGGRTISDDLCMERDVNMESCHFFDQQQFKPSFLPE